MMAKLRALVSWLLESKVSNGFAFLLYMAMCFALGLVLKASFLEVSAALFAGLSVQTGQRTYTKVSLTKAELSKGKAPTSDPKEAA